jgi:hypothetical protein
MRDVFFPLFSKICKTALLCSPALPHFPSKNRTPATWLTSHIESWGIRTASCICSPQGDKITHTLTIFDILIHSPFILIRIHYLVLDFTSCGLDSEARISISLTSKTYQLRKFPLYRSIKLMLTSLKFVCVGMCTVF